MNPIRIRSSVDVPVMDPILSLTKLSVTNVDPVTIRDPKFWMSSNRMLVTNYLVKAPSNPDSISPIRQISKCKKMVKNLKKVFTKVLIYGIIIL